MLILKAYSITLTFMSIIYDLPVKICRYLMIKKTYLNFEKRFLTLVYNIFNQSLFLKKVGISKSSRLNWPVAALSSFILKSLGCVFSILIDLSVSNPVAITVIFISS